ncbi:MAG: ArgE/DapE family deacylase [Deltaproteobacteria bacterium]|nr:ArgE/DapE family deacylase [Deltaproteobacteria bacterium]
MLDIKEKQIVQEVEGLSDEILEFTSRLVAQPSILGHEKSALEVMESELSRLALDPVQVPINPDDLSKHPGFAPTPWDYENRYNVIGVRRASGQGGRSALFNGHLDVVSPEPLKLWEYDPFEPFIKDSWLHGRGAGDMKSGVAAMTYALHAVEKAGFGLNASVTIEAVIEEECSGNGALACLNAGYDAEAVLIPEPMGPGVLTGQVGVLWFKVNIFGVPRHVSEATAGVNAIEKSYTIISALRELEAEMNQEVHPAYRQIPHPLNLNIGIIKSGDWPSTVPAEAEFHCRLSYFPGMAFNQVQEKIVQTIEKAAQSDPWLAENRPVVEFYAFRSDGHIAKPDLPGIKTLKDCHKTITGKDAIELASTATTDLRAFHFFGHGDATCYGPLAEKIHAANERVKVETIIETAKVYALFLARWCGLAE